MVLLKWSSSGNRANCRRHGRCPEPPRPDDVARRPGDGGRAGVGRRRGGNSMFCPLLAPFYSPFLPVFWWIRAILKSSKLFSEFRHFPNLGHGEPFWWSRANRSPNLYGKVLNLRPCSLENCTLPWLLIQKVHLMGFPSCLNFVTEIPQSKRSS